MSLLVNLSNESTRDKPINVEVYACRGEGTVTLTLPQSPDEHGCDYRILDSEEARALAAALVHYADESER